VHSRKISNALGASVQSEQMCFQNFEQSRPTETHVTHAEAPYTSNSSIVIGYSIADADSLLLLLL